MEPGKKKEGGGGALVQHAQCALAVKHAVAVVVHMNVLFLFDTFNS